ncbi:beta-ketoacyl synthase N-terminal-like domain-containing protein [Pedosphaera parvula]|uniref:Beta-ketoacyl synthase n=1 Tax=Pedosphaera parvula (strain Ellin514) TaxID=320771 RepID=B9XAY9_PEDPL|nr:polyketide synthase [Pedosphaera parvula]EEF63174.1 Beta-ketoacyl synthase [Pedosphaera parvula Ellin514]
MIETVTEGIAIIGMTGRFPGASNIEEFWRNLATGVESISTFSDDELAASGLDVAAIRKTPGYVAARGILKNAEWFDAAFFGMNSKEAEVTDPQQRLFLEGAWEALEHAGYDPERYAGSVGVYAGMGNNTYYINNLHLRPDVLELVGPMATMMGNEKDYLTTRVAYKLNLKGPAINVNTACSTSLVAVCQACQSLLNYQCDMALAGGISVSFPQKRGYFYQEGGITSSDGHCRAFDAQAQGTVSSDGLGIVVLKRLAEAIKHGDQIYAVIKGVGLNNDGSFKVSFTSPSVGGQAETIALAQAQARFRPRYHHLCRNAWYGHTIRRPD